MKKNIATTLSEYLNEQVLNNLILYRGVEKESFKPTDFYYSFFSKERSFAEDYGDYIWKCTFKPMNLFISYNEDSIKELYDNGFKLRDYYIEDNWENNNEFIDTYDYDQSKSFDDWGYKSATDVISSPYFNSDTWEMIEHSHGVLDYILSKYDGVSLIEGGQVTYYLRTDKIIDCVRE